MSCAFSNYLPQTNVIKALQILDILGRSDIYFLFMSCTKTGNNLLMLGIKFSLRLKICLLA